MRAALSRSHGGRIRGASHEVARRYGVSLRAQHVDPRRGTGVDWHLSGKAHQGPGFPGRTLETGGALAHAAADVQALAHLTDGFGVLADRDQRPDKAGEGYRSRH
jgi:hypothetical protein